MDGQREADEPVVLQKVRLLSYFFFVVEDDYRGRRAGVRICSSCYLLGRGEANERFICQFDVIIGGIILHQSREPADKASRG